MKELGGTLRAWRKARNMSIYDVERQTGIGFGLVSAYERGEKRPSLQNARKLAKLFGVPVAYLVLDPGEVAECIPPELKDVVELFLRRPEVRNLVALLADLPPAGVQHLADFLHVVKDCPPDTGQES
ncbi:MAG TPA: helix-turn-helix transcriptional regulator [Firmicutes bacterium]|nr:helix-turn-helix transcriptional regulator [Bacillota bacterium]